MPPSTFTFDDLLAWSERLPDWQRVRIALHAPLVEEFWVAPIETVSESEEGFERVYQGSQILALWRPPAHHPKNLVHPPRLAH